MDASPPPNQTAGQRLARRREELDLTQEALARRIGISSVSVSSAERDKSEISKGKRATWEQALELKPGSIGRLYRTGADLESLDLPREPPYANLADRHERSIWEMDGLPEKVRRQLIDTLRKGRAPNEQAG